MASHCTEPKRSTPNSFGDTRNKITCNLCGQQGHIARNCPSKAPGNDTNKPKGGSNNKDGILWLKYDWEHIYVFLSLFYFLLPSLIKILIILKILILIYFDLMNIL